MACSSCSHYYVITNVCLQKLIFLCLGIDYTPDVMKKAVALVEKFRAFLGDARSYCKGTWNRGDVSASTLLQVRTKEVTVISFKAV